VCARVCVRACACVRLCVRACMCARVCVCVLARELHDNKTELGRNNASLMKSSAVSGSLNSNICRREISSRRLFDNYPFTPHQLSSA
jgi:hypothetical protein